MPMFWKKTAAIILAGATLLAGIPAATADDTTPTPTATTTADGQTATGDTSQLTAEQQAKLDQANKENTDIQEKNKEAQTPKGDTAPVADVTINDMLDTDAAGITKLKLTDTQTGTAPFDADDQPGDDSSAGNDTIRSFDTITYNYEYSVTPDSTMTYYKRTRIGFRFTLPYDASVATFDTNSMSWVDRTAGYEPKTTTETIDGVKTQVYTCYRLLEPTSSSPTVNPGTSSIQLAVKVRGAKNGQTIQPTVNAWAAWNKTNPTDTGKHKALTDTPKQVTVSAKLNLNTEIAYRVVGGGTYDFSTGDQTAPNKTRGKVQGRQLHVQVLTSMRWPDRTKGLKGLEAPTGNIGYTLNVSNAFQDDDDKHTKHKGEKQWQPILWDRVYSDNSNVSEHNRSNDSFDHGGMFPYSKQVNRDSVNNGSTTYDAGTTTEDGTKVNVSFNGYSVTDFPCSYASLFWNYHQCSTRLMSSSSADSVQQVAPLHMDEFVFILPTSTTDGKTAAEHYGKDQIGSITITDTSLTATSLSGSTLDRTDTNSNQAVTNDDAGSGNWNVRLSGKFIQRLMYTSNSSPDTGYANSATTGTWTDPEYTQGSDRVLAGRNIGILSDIYNNLDSVANGRVIGYHLIKWDPTVLTPLAAESNPTQPYKVRIDSATWGARFNWSDTVDGNGQAPVVWGVRPDGKNFANDTEQAKASYGDFNWYDTYAEAAKHGLVLAATIINTHVWDSENTTFGERIENALTLPVKVNESATGRTAQTTGQTDYWTRESLAKASGLDPDKSTFAQWTAFAHNLGHPSYTDFVKQYGQPDLHYDGKNYVKAKFSDDGVYQGGDTAGDNKGDTLYVVGEQPHINITTSQKADDNKTSKTIYDLDKEQRYADWTVDASAKTGANSQNKTYLVDYYVKITLSKGLSYVDGSSYVDGDYTEHDSGREQGTVTGGTPLTPTITKNNDGTTTLEYTVTGRSADGTDTHVHFSTFIGDPSDPNNDAKNSQQYTVHTEIRSKRWMGEPRASLGQTADYTIKISRLHSSALATRAKTLLNERDSTLGYTNMLANFGNDAKPNPYAVDVMPHQGDGSTYSGDWTLTGLTVKASNGASLDGMKVWFTTDVKWRDVDAAKITREQIQQWTEAKVDATTGRITIPQGFDRPVAWAFTSPGLPANARYDFTVDMTPSGNRPGDTYRNRWADGDNKVDAYTYVVNREVNGVVWFDANENGIRETGDHPLADVTVTLVDKSGNPVTSTNGQPLSTVTGDDGHYELDGVPAGSGYRLKFTPDGDSAATWPVLHVTVQNAKDASEAYDSDVPADESLTDGMAFLSLNDFPEIAKMTSSVYVDEYEDLGIAGSLPSPTVQVSFQAVKTLTGRDWKTGDEYVADVTPRNGAPAQGLPSTITFTSSDPVTVAVDQSVFTAAGSYEYEVRERDTHQGGVTYDPSVWTVTVTVTDDMTTLERAIGVTLSKDGAAADRLSFANSYAPSPATVSFDVSKTFDGDDLSDANVTDFRFSLYATADGTGKPVQTVNADRNGHVTFQPVQVSAADLNGEKSATLHYSVREENGHAKGVTYDTHVASWTVNASDDGQGHVVATVNPDADDTGRFVNSYKSSPVTVTPKAVKTLTGRVLRDGEFSFTLKENDRTVSTASNKADGTIRFPDITYDAVGEHDYTISETRGVLGGVTYDATTHVMHVSVTDNGQGRLEAQVTYDGKTDVPTFANTYTIAPATVSFDVEKTFDGDAASDANVTDFRFSLYATADGTGEPVQTVNADKNGHVTFQPVPINPTVLDGNATATLHYSVREENDGAAGVTYDAHVASWTVEASDDGQGHLRVISNQDPDHVNRFVNSYKAAPVTVTPHAVKTLTGRALNDGEFSFTLKENDRTVSTASNKADGTIRFPDITYDAVGEHDYTISETRGVLGGVTYDATTHVMHVSVTDNGQGRLEAQVTYDGKTDPPTFANTYTAQPATVDLTATKSFDNDAASDTNVTDFEFTLHESADGSGPVLATVHPDKQGRIPFPTLTFDKPGDHTYSAVETHGNAGGVTYSGHVAVWRVNVTDNLKGSLVAVVSNEANHGPEFTNTYRANPVYFTPQGVKVMTGRTLRDGEFTFTLKENGRTVSTASNRADGAIRFPDITYTTIGEHDYTIEETPGDHPEGGVTYDTTPRRLHVTVVDNGDGQLVARASYDGKDEPSVFHNTYTTQPAHATPTVVKHVEVADGNTWTMKGGEFSFTLTRVQAPDGAADMTSMTASNKADGSVAFDAVTFDRPGEYRYRIVENEHGIPGMSRDTHVATVTYTVADDGDGQLKVVTTTTAKDDTVFTNRYDPKSATLALGGVKTIRSDDPSIVRTPKDGEFSFRLTGEGNAPMPASVETSNTGDGFSFEPITFTRPGTYRYEIREIGGVESTMGYDSHVEHVTVTVTDEHGALRAVADRETSDVAFVNTYTPTPAAVTLTVGKTLAGRAIRAGEFSATLTDDRGRAVDAAFDKDGRAAFPLTLDRTGVYRYVVREKDTGVNGVSYDPTAYTATVTVSENSESHVLEAVVAWDAQPVFRNTYTPSRVEVAVDATKLMSGRDLKDGEFTFDLVDGDGVVVASAVNRSDGSVHMIVPVDRAGTYRWTLRERVTGEERVVYDMGEYHATVAVTDDLDGRLTASLVWDAQPVFRNVYEPVEAAAPAAVLAQTGAAGGVAVLAALLAGLAAAVMLVARRRRG